MIHSAYNKSEIARLYYLSKTGEDLVARAALNRFLHLKHVDKPLLKKIFKEISQKQLEQLS